MVVTKAKADIFLDKSLTGFYDWVRMGTRLAMSKRINSEIVCVVIPFKTETVLFRKKPRICDGRMSMKGF